MIEQSPYYSVFGREAYSGLEREHRLTDEAMGKVKTSYHLFTLLVMNDLAEVEKENKVLEIIDCAVNLETDLIQPSDQRKRKISEVEVEAEAEVRISKRINDIEAARIKTSDGQNNQAVKMLRKNKKVINSFKVGDLVLLATEGIDRGAADAQNILCYIMDGRRMIHFNKTAKLAL